MVDEIVAKMWKRHQELAELNGGHLICRVNLAEFLCSEGCRRPHTQTMRTEAIRELAEMGLLPRKYPQSKRLYFVTPEKPCL